MHSVQRSQCIMMLKTHNPLHIISTAESCIATQIYKYVFFFFFEIVTMLKLHLQINLQINL